VPDLGAELRTASASVSQCGYNTALDVLRAGVPALVVPFADEGEDEQLRRAGRLERLGAVRVLEPSRLSGPALAAELDALRSFRPRRLALDLDGARTTAALLAGLAAPELEAVS
jgi:predicted glycosyltransferase